MSERGWHPGRAGESQQPTLPGAPGTDPSAGEATTLGTGDARHTPAPLSPGTVVAGDYRIERQIGVGAMGVVYLARHLKLDREVALKVWRGVGSDGVARLVREAKAMARLSHPNVVTVFDVREHEGELFIAMEYVAGGTVRELLAARRLPWALVVDLYVQAAHGLAAAHAAGMVHRDFKPDNVLVGADGKPRVGDFGIARAIQGDPDAHAGAGVPDAGLGTQMTETGRLMGTPAYMAPEQFAGHADARTDQFAFCVSLWEGLHGRRPFAGQSPAQLLIAMSERRVVAPAADLAVPAWVREVLMRGLSPDPRARWPSMAALVDALGRPPMASAKVIAAIACALVLVGAGAGGLAWMATAGGDGPATVVAAPVPAHAPAPETAPAPAPAPDPETTPPAPRPAPDPDPADGREPAPDADASEAWSGTQSFWCAQTTREYRGQTIRVTEGPAFQVAENCRLRLIDCDIRAPTIISGGGKSEVEIVGGRLHATEQVLWVGGTSRVTLREVEIVDDTHEPMFWVGGDARVTLARLSARADVVLYAAGNAHVTLEDVKLIGREQAVNIAGYATVKAHAVALEGPKRVAASAKWESD